MKNTIKLLICCLMISLAEAVPPKLPDGLKWDEAGKCENPFVEICVTCKNCDGEVAPGVILITPSIVLYVIFPTVRTDDGFLCVDARIHEGIQDELLEAQFLWK